MYIGLDLFQIILTKFQSMTKMSDPELFCPGYHCIHELAKTIFHSYKICLHYSICINIATEEKNSLNKILLQIKRFFK